ncbi:metallophosphoesterase family protein [Virgibacillus sediminis]|uniref:Phosphoesterase n=1 Tax=Virgibacillus sediminis TaxID=202260 RepID=A0ABV7A9L4_9BACI
MKLVITGDTHMPRRGTQLPARLEQELKTANLIIHTGDWQTMDMYHMLSEFGEVRGVFGNVDGEDICRKFPEKLVLELEGYRIGVVHGHGERKTTERRAIEAFDGEDLDIIIFGHSHIPLLRYSKRRLLLNPGSPMDKRTTPYYSFAVLHLGPEIRAEHVFYDEKI